MAAHDGSLFEETYNLLNAWLSIVPGNGAHNLRRLALLETNVADLSFLFTLDHGERGQPAPAAARRSPSSRRRIRRRTPSTCTSQDVGHTLVLGRDRQRQELPPELPRHARAEVRPAHGHLRSRPQLPEARDAPRRAATWSSGCGSATSRSIPFALEPTPEHLHFLHAFVRVLLEGDDGYRLSDARGPRALRGGREPLRARSRASGACSRWRTCCRERWPAACTSGSRAAATRASSTTSRTR